MVLVGGTRGPWLDRFHPPDFPSSYLECVGFVRHISVLGNLDIDNIVHIFPISKQREIGKMSDDAALVRHLYDYDQETGEFLLRNYAEGTRGTRTAIGEPAGTIDKRDGSRVIRLGGKLHRASRLAWLWVHGEWPDRQVIYKDPQLPIPARDRLSNLRLSGKQSDISQEELKRLLRYDPDAGEFFWRVARKGIVLGSRAGGKRPTGDGKEYWYISIDRTEYLGHRLAWLYTYGRWPASRIVFR